MKMVLFFFCCAATVVVAYFFPNCRRGEQPQFISEHVFELITSKKAKRIDERCRGSETLTGSLEKEWFDFQIHPPLPSDAPVTRLELAAYYAQLSRAFPRLATLLTTFLGFAVSEAECERKFSALKLEIPPCRNRLRAEAVEAQLVLNGSAKNLSGKTEEQVEDDGGGDGEDEHPPSAITTANLIGLSLHQCCECL